jgi:hypothetical protein
MQTATREETRFIQRIIIFVIFPLMACIFFSFWLAGRNAKVTERIENIEKSLEVSLKKYGTIPTLKKVSAEKAEHKSLLGEYETLKTFATVKPISPPQEVIEKGVYFKKQLFLAQKSISELAAKKGIHVPATIGFGESLPSDKEVSLLLRKLETISSIVRVILNENIEAITVIKQLDDVRPKTSQGRELPGTEISFRIDINCSRSSIVPILHQIGLIKPFVVIKDISAKNFKDDLLEVSLICSRLISEE